MYEIKPPIQFVAGELPLNTPLNGLVNVLAARLSCRRGREAIRQTAHTLLVMAEVAPNPQVLAEHLSEFTQGDHTISVQ